MLPLGASAVTLGLGMIVVFNRPPLDVRNFPMLIPIAHSLVALPFVVRAIQPALQSIPPRCARQPVCWGHRLAGLVEVDLPIIGRGACQCHLFLYDLPGRIWGNFLPGAPGSSHPARGNFPVPFPARRVELWSGNGDGNHTHAIVCRGDPGQRTVDPAGLMTQNHGRYHTG